MKTLAPEAHRPVIYVKNATWWLFDGTLATAKKLPDTCRHRYFDGELGEMCRAAQKRPRNFLRFSEQEQWEIDKNLGVLDWDGEPTT